MSKKKGDKSVKRGDWGPQNIMLDVRKQGWNDDVVVDDDNY